MSKKDIVVGLDIGTTKICCVIAEFTDGEGPGAPTRLELLGMGSYPSTGLKKGVVVNIDATVESISKAVKAAEMMSGIHVASAIVGIAGGHIKSFNSTGVVAVKGREITRSDLNRVIDAANAVAIPMDREVLHTFPQEYIVDSEEGIHDPIGMSGVRLEAKVHIVTGAVSSAQNLVRSANKAGVNVTGVCLEPIASSEAVLTPEEKELGVILVDIGGGTTDVALFKDGSVIHTFVLPIGGNHVTQDLSLALSTSFQDAEKIKIEHGCALSSLVGGLDNGSGIAEEMIEVPGVSGRKSQSVSKKLIAEIIEPRLEEMFSLAQREILQSGHRHLLSGGVVVTGGGTLLPGVPELAEVIFGMPTKRGIPTGVSGLGSALQSPKYATAVGLLLYGVKNRSKRNHLAQSFVTLKNSKASNKASHMASYMASWIKELF